MQVPVFASLPVFACLAVTSSAMQMNGNPLSAVLGTLQDMSTRIEKDGVVDGKVYRKFFSWCNGTAEHTLRSIKLDEKRLAKLKAEIDRYLAEVELLGEKINEEAGAIAQSIHDAKVAKDERETQHADFVVAAKELEETIDTLSRAAETIERKMQKSPSFAQSLALSNMKDVLHTVDVIIDGTQFEGTDKAKLAALLQARDSDDDDLSAPATPSYSFKGGNILDVLEDLKDKADNQLYELRLGERQAETVYQRLLAGLDLQRKADENDLSNLKKDKSSAEEGAASSRKELKRTTASLDMENQAYQATRAQCMQTSSDHEQAVNSRTAELKVLAEGIEVLETMTSGAVEQTYSFFQEASVHRASGMALNEAGSQVLALVKRMATIHHSKELSQLASRINAVIRYSTGSSEDPFVNVKKLILELINKLEKQIRADSTEKAYCDEQQLETSNKEDELEDKVKAVTVQINEDSAKSAGFKAQIKEIQADLVELEKEQSGLEKVRKEERVAFSQTKKDLNQGLEGVRKAIQLLRDYYTSKDDDASVASNDVPEDASFMQKLQQPTPPDLTHHKASTEAENVIGVLEMCESDFATSLAKQQTEESDAENQFEKAMSEISLERAMKQQEITFKTAEYKKLDKQITQQASDRDTVTAEQAAVAEYASKVKERCVAKPSQFEQRSQRRKATITGLKEALEIIKREGSFIQRTSYVVRHKHFLA